MILSQADLQREISSEYGAAQYGGTHYCPGCGIATGTTYKHNPGCPYLAAALAAQVPAFVQAGTPSDSSSTSVSSGQVILPNQTAGNWNIVAYAWFDTSSTVTSISDSANNTYLPVFSAPIRASAYSLVIYYCPNIQNGPNGGLANNAITLVTSGAAGYRVMHALEYTGLGPTAAVIDATGSAFATGTAYSVPITTLNANDLIIGFFVGQGGPITAGQTQRSVTPIDGSIVEDVLVTSAGSNPMTGTSGSAAWVGGALAIKAGKYAVQFPGAILHN